MKKTPGPIGEKQELCTRPSAHLSWLLLKKYGSPCGYRTSTPDAESTTLWPDVNTKPSEGALAEVLRPRAVAMFLEIELSGLLH